MVVVILMSIGAALIITAYRRLQTRASDQFSKTMFSVKQQASVIISIANGIFSIITSLETASIQPRTPQAVLTDATSTKPGVPPGFGKPAALTGAVATT